MNSLIRIEFRRDPVTGEPRAALLDADTGALKSLSPLRHVATRLANDGYEWVVGSNGLWRKAA